MLARADFREGVVVFSASPGSARVAAAPPAAFAPATLTACSYGLTADARHCDCCADKLYAACIAGKQRVFYHSHKFRYHRGSFNLIGSGYSRTRAPSVP